jgi:uncharacterized protein
MQPEKPSPVKTVSDTANDFVQSVEKSVANVSPNQWAMLLHLSTFAGGILPGLGFVAPIVIWQLKKDSVPGLDQHGKNLTNWLISAIIYGAISAVLIFAIVGFFLLIALGILAVIFPIIAAIKANNGETWTYPLSITFIK